MSSKFRSLQELDTAMEQYEKMSEADKPSLVGLGAVTILATAIRHLVVEVKQIRLELDQLKKQ